MVMWRLVVPGWQREKGTSKGLVKSHEVFHIYTPDKECMNERWPVTPLASISRVHFTTLIWVRPQPSSNPTFMYTFIICIFLSWKEIRLTKSANRNKNLPKCLKPPLCWPRVHLAIMAPTHMHKFTR